MQVGDLVRIDGGTLRPKWFGEVGVITTLTVPEDYLVNPNFPWYGVVLQSSGFKYIRGDMLEAVNASR